MASWDEALEDVLRIEPLIHSAVFRGL